MIDQCCCVFCSFVCFLSVFKGAFEQERKEGEQEIQTRSHRHRRVTKHGDESSSLKTQAEDIRADHLIFDMASSDRCVKRCTIMFWTRTMN